MTPHEGQTGKQPDAIGHVPVMLAEALEALNIQRGGRYVDGTFGGGGHASEIARQIGPDGAIIAFDRDADAAVRSADLARRSDAEILFVNAPFSSMAAVVQAEGFGPVDGVLLDLGLSSFQLDSAERGFSFRQDGPLDMRMDSATGEPAAALVARSTEAELAQLLFEFGEERQARRIARAIVAEREERPMVTTAQLAELVERTIGRPPGARIHPATRTFQALRIAVNDELNELRRGLEAALQILRTGGRIVVVSFHSLEDRIVKQWITQEVKGCVCPPDQPICTCGRKPRLRSISKAQRPGNVEVAANPRARSAIMRGAERLP